MINLSGDSGEDGSNLMDEEHLKMLKELAEKPSSVSVKYNSLNMGKARLEHAKNNLDIITGSGDRVHLTEKGLNFLMQHRLNQNLEGLDENIDSLRDSMSIFNMISLVCTTVLILFAIAQISVSTEIFGSQITFLALIGGLILWMLGSFTMLLRSMYL